MIHRMTKRGPEKVNVKRLAGHTKWGRGVSLITIDWGQ